MLPEQSIALTQGLTRHLFVADALGVQRFPISNGIPSRNYDRTYSSVHTPIAVDAQGTLPPPYHYPYSCWGLYTVGAAIDIYGNLLLSNSGPTNFSGNGIYTFASPASQPTYVRTLSPSGAGQGGLAISTSNDLYAVFPVAASGSPPPTREISIAGAPSFLILETGIATAAGRLFVPDYYRNAVYEVYSTKGGLQTPISTLSISAPVDVKFGL